MKGWFRYTYEFFKIAQQLGNECQNMYGRKMDHLNHVNAYQAFT